MPVIIGQTITKLFVESYVEPCKKTERSFLFNVNDRKNTNPVEYFINVIKQRTTIKISTKNILTLRKKTF